MRGRGFGMDYVGVFYRVRLFSDMFPFMKRVSFQDVPETADRLELRIEVAGGALAEHQNATLGDRHDPSHCARAALELFRELRAAV